MKKNDNNRPKECYISYKARQEDSEEFANVYVFSITHGLWGCAYECDGRNLECIGYVPVIKKPIDVLNNKYLGELSSRHFVKLYKHKSELLNLSKTITKTRKLQKELKGLRKYMISKPKLLEYILTTND